MIFPGRPEPTTPRQRGLTPDGADAAAPCDLAGRNDHAPRAARPLDRALDREPDDIKVVVELTG
jgi:hypothetical protein